MITIKLYLRPHKKITLVFETEKQSNDFLTELQSAPETALIRAGNFVFPRQNIRFLILNKNVKML